MQFTNSADLTRHQLKRLQKVRESMQKTAEDTERAILEKEVEAVLSGEDRGANWTKKAQSALAAKVMRGAPNSPLLRKPPTSFSPQEMAMKHHLDYLMAKEHAHWRDQMDDTAKRRYWEKRREKQRNHPYSRKNPTAPGLPINERTGRLKRSIRATRGRTVRTRSFAIKASVPYARFILSKNGTKFMIPRPALRYLRLATQRWSRMFSVQYIKKAHSI